VDLADVRFEGGGEGDGGGVGAAAAEGDGLAGVGDALEAADNRDASGGDLAAQSRIADVADAGAGVVGLGADAALLGGEADGVAPEGLKGERHEGAGDLLAGHEELVELSFAGRGVALAGEG